MLAVFIALGLFYKFIITPYVEITNKQSNEYYENNNKISNTSNPEKIKIIQRSSKDIFFKFLSASIEKNTLILKWQAKGTDIYTDNALICVYAFNKNGNLLSTLNKDGKKAQMPEMSACGYTSAGETVPFYLADIAISRLAEELDIREIAKNFSEKPYSIKVEALVLDNRTSNEEWSGLIASDLYDELLRLGNVGD
jgi:protein associated with RNAse G/E